MTIHIRVIIAQFYIADQYLTDLSPGTLKSKVKWKPHKLGLFKNYSSLPKSFDW